MQSFKAVVIGAGIAGLTAIKACKEEGVCVVCYERSSSIGGLWRIRKESDDADVSVLNTTVTNSSKEMSAFSDFPPPDDFPNYMTQNDVMKYLSMYADKFQLLEHIRFEHEVLEVRPVPEFKVTGKWKVRFRCLAGETSEETFNAVFVCSGQLARPWFPTVPGMDCFLGEVKHSAHYKCPEQMAGKEVLIVGAGNSAADIAVEIAPLAKKVYMSCRRGTWLLPRTGYRGLPVDLMITRFLLNLPFALDLCIAETLANWWIDHKLYGLQPTGRIWELLPTINDFLLTRILSGKVIMKGGVEGFIENGVMFCGEQEPTAIDAVIFATGYRPNFRFLDRDSFPDHNPSSFYKRIFPTNLLNPTLALIGFLSTVGSLWPVMELQSRWAVAVVLRKLNLPPKEKMIKEIQKMKCKDDQLHLEHGRREIPLMSVRYSDELARDLGVKPSIFRIALQDPAFSWACITGPWLPYQYRLVGPNSWLGAKEAILSFKERIFAPINKENEKKKLKKI